MGPVEIKGIVLIIVALGGVASLWIGYRLYLHGVIEKGKLAITAPGNVKITVADYGPGVAFWALGVVLLIFAVNRDLTTSTEVTRTVRPNVQPQPTSTLPPAYDENINAAAAAADLGAGAPASASPAVQGTTVKKEVSAKTPSPPTPAKPRPPVVAKRAPDVEASARSPVVEETTQRETVSARDGPTTKRVQDAKAAGSVNEVTVRTEAKGHVPRDDRSYDGPLDGPRR